MLKAERQKNILLSLKKNRLIKVSELSYKLNVTEMTIRRDLEELEAMNLLKRIHGGARSIDFFPSKEYSHDQKKSINIEGKNKIAQLMVNIISDDDIVYMGTGSTIEAVSKYLEDKKFKLVTNSLELFNSIKNNNNIESMLIGGNYRPNTGAFVGKFASDVIRNLRFKIAFAGTNGVNENDIFTYNEEEGEVQKIALNNSMEKYIVADSSKMKHQDFLSYYKTENLDAIISDNGISKEAIDMIQSYTNLIYK